MSTEKWLFYHNDQDGVRPNSIEVHVYANGVDTGLVIVLSAKNGWSAEWTNLPAYHEGILVIYTVVETPVDGYEAEYAYNGHKVTITNHYEPEQTEVSVSKVWDDEENCDGIRPDEVVITLVADGVATDKALVLNAQNNWYGEWTDLPKYANGKLISYTVVEAEIPQGYISIVETVADSEYAFVVTNQHTPLKTSEIALKLWEDNDDAKNVRPDQVVIALLANGEIVDEVILSEANAWSYTWLDLYQYADGAQIVYTVEEISNDANYLVSYIVGEGTNGEVVWQITNTFVDVTPDTGDSIGSMFLPMIFSMAGVLLMVPAVRKKEHENEA